MRRLLSGAKPAIGSADQTAEQLALFEPIKEQRAALERPLGLTMRTAHEAAKSGLGEIIVPREIVERLEHHPEQSPRPRRLSRLHA
jgi:hypothetical protein